MSLGQQNQTCVWATVRKKLETERRNKYVSEKEKCVQFVCGCLLACWKLGHSLQLSGAEDRLATEVG